MAVAADIERKLEDAFIARLAANTDLSSARIAREDVATAVAAASRYPCVTVRCDATAEEPWSDRKNYSHSYVEITAYTYTRTDTTGATAAALLGAVRDTLYGATLVSDLSAAVSGLTVFGVVCEDPVTISDDDRRRVRSVTVKVLATARDIG